MTISEIFQKAIISFNDKQVGVIVFAGVIVTREAVRLLIGIETNRSARDQ